jgi:hypothetical protein
MMWCKPEEGSQGDEPIPDKTTASTKSPADIAISVITSLQPLPNDDSAELLLVHLVHLMSASTASPCR